MNHALIDVDGVNPRRPRGEPARELTFTASDVQGAKAPQRDFVEQSPVIVAVVVPAGDCARHTLIVPV